MSCQAVCPFPLRCPVLLAAYVGQTALFLQQVCVCVTAISVCERAWSFSLSLSLFWEHYSRQRSSSPVFTRRTKHKSKSFSSTLPLLTKLPGQRRILSLVLWHPGNPLMSPQLISVCVWCVCVHVWDQAFICIERLLENTYCMKYSHAVWKVNTFLCDNQKHCCNLPTIQNTP